MTGAGITISTADHQLFNGAVYTIKHANSVTARTDYMQPYVKYDAQGHITGSSYWMATAKGTDGSAGWIKVATIKHTKTYDNTPFLLDISQRGNSISYRIHIRWDNLNSVDPSLGEFLIASDHAWESISPSAYIIKSNTSTWDLYIKKLDSYDALAMRLQPGRYFDDHTEWTWKDEQTAASAITGGTEATKKIYSTTDHTHDSLTSKTLTKTTLEGTAGNFFFKGDNLLGGINDWVGIQADAGNDKFQMIANSNKLLFRQNDTGGTNTTNWQAWNYLMTPECVTGENGITATIREGSIGSGESATPANIGVKIGHSNSVTAVTTTSLLKFQYDAQGHITGSSAITKDDITGLGIPASDTNNQVYQSNSTTGNYRPIVMGYTSKDSLHISELTTAVTNQVYVNEKLYVQPSTGKLFSDGGFYITANGEGLRLTDSTGGFYAGIVDNGANLWIGSGGSSSKHHTGKTFISTGYTGTTGNSTIYVAIPNDTNNGCSTYSVLHVGNVGYVMPTTPANDWTDIGLTSDSTFGFSVVRGGVGSDTGNPPNWWGGSTYKYGMGLAFGNRDTGGSISMKYTAPGITFAGGSRSSSATRPSWYISLTGTSGNTYDLDNLPGKYAFIYDSTSDFASYSWHKFAEVTVTDANADATITFLVSKTWGNPPYDCGILTAHVRTTSAKIYSSGHFRWLILGKGGTSRINPEDFVFVYTNTASTSCKVELWYKQNAQYDGFVFKVLKEHSRVTYGAYPWTLYSYAGHGSASYTTGTGYFSSSADTELVNVASSANKINTDAGDSMRPVYVSGGIPVQVAVPLPGAWFSAVPRVNNSGVLEIGKYIDFHATTNSANDYDVRFNADTTNMVTMSSNGGTTTFRIAGTLPTLRFQQTTSGQEYDAAACGIICRPANTNGVNMYMQSGGCIVIGAGEFGSNAYARKDSTGTTQVGYDNLDTSISEKLYLGADGEVQIISNGQSIGTYTNNDHRVWKFKTDGSLAAPDNVIVEKDSSSNATDGGALGFVATRSDTNVSCIFGVGIGGTNHGIYSYKLNSWVIYGSDTDVYLRTKLYNPSTTSSALAISFYGSAPSTGTKQLYNNDGLCYITGEGSTSQTGEGCIVLGNATGSGTNGNKHGTVRIYSDDVGYIQLQATSTSTSKTQTLSPMNGVVCCLNKNSTSYWGLYDGTGSATATTSWIRSTSNGFIPYQSGGLTSPHSGLGTSTWAFSSSWIATMNGVDVRIYNSTANKYHSITSIASANRTVMLPDTNCTVGTGFISVVGTHTSATKMWTGNIPIPALYDGLTIAFYVPYSSASSTNSEVGDTSANSNVWLKLTLSDGTTTDWIPVYWNATSRLTTHHGAGSTVVLTYWSAPKVSGTTSSARWTHADYNTNTQVNVTLNTTSKAYLLATTSTPTSTASGRSAVADTGVYLDTTAGMLTATSLATKVGSYRTSITNGSSNTANRTTTMPDIDGEVQVSNGQELIFESYISTASSSASVTVTDFFRKYRIILIEVLGLKYSNTQYCFKSVWPVKFIENLSGSGYNFLTMETTGDTADRLLITKKANGFQLMTYSGGSFPVASCIRVYSLL